MSVHKIFWEDPYKTELNTTVTSVNQEIITLKETIIFSFSGGQDSDSGKINGKEILSSEWIENEIYYNLGENHGINTGDSVILNIDWDKRYRLMKLHFAAEIILELMYQNYENPEKIGANITKYKARIDFYWDENISKIFPELTHKANSLIKNNLEIISDFSDKDKEIRFWEIKNFGKVNCGGTHIKKTGEIIEITLKRKNIGKGKERIEIFIPNN